MLWLGIGIASCFAACFVGLVLAFRSAPIGFECDRCGFIRGDEAAERLHLLSHDIADDPRFAEQTTDQAIESMTAYLREGQVTVERLFATLDRIRKPAS